MFILIIVKQALVGYPQNLSDNAQLDIRNKTLFALDALNGVFIYIKPYLQHIGKGFLRRPRRQRLAELFNLWAADIVCAVRRLVFIYISPTLF